ncbi:MAG: hypothetical protein V1495_00370 [Pseudomonadota bacterium]
MSKSKMPWGKENRTKKVWVGVEPTFFEALKERADELHYASVSEYVRKVVMDDLLHGTLNEKKK